MGQLDDKDDDKLGTDKDTGQDDVVVIENEGEGDDGDRRLARGDEQRHEDDDDPEGRRQRNRAARRQRKERQRQVWERNRQLEQMLTGMQDALNQANARIAKIEQGSVEDHGQRLERSLAGAEAAMERAKATLKKAQADQDADAIVAASEAIARIAVDQRDIQAARDRFAQSRAKDTDDDDQDDRRGGKGERTPADDQTVIMQKTILRNAAIFARKHDWYDPNDDKGDSALVRKLDAEIAREGYNPATAEYWQELEQRVKEELPHRSAARDDDDGDEDTGRNNGKDTGRNNGKDRTPLTGGSGNNGRDRGGKEYRLSAARVEAIKEAGMWDDPVGRKKMIDSYKKWDREHPEQKRGA